MKKKKNNSNAVVISFLFVVCLSLGVESVNCVQLSVVSGAGSTDEALPKDSELTQLDHIHHHHHSGQGQYDDRSMIGKNQTNKTSSHQLANTIHEKPVHILSIGTHNSKQFNDAKLHHDLHEKSQPNNKNASKQEEQQETDEELKLDDKGKELKSKLQDNSLFNQISGYAPTGGWFGTVINFFSKQLDKLAGLSESSNDSYISSLLVCKKFYQDKDQNKTQQNIFSRYGDIAQINDNTYVDCGRSIMNMQQFHVVRYSPIAMLDGGHGQHTQHHDKESGQKLQNDNPSQNQNEGTNKMIGQRKESSMGNAVERKIVQILPIEASD